MKLYLIRHGDTVAPTVNPERPLTEIGHDQAKDLGQFLRGKNIQPNHLFHSGILRANQTAEHIHEAFDHDHEYKMVENLTPTSPIQHWADEILGYEQDVVLVGHMPFMGLMLEELSGKLESFPNCGCVCLSKNENGHWIIDWKSW